MDRNSVIGIIIIAIILIGYSVLMKPSKEEMEARRRSADSLKQAQTEQMLEQQKVQESREAAAADTLAPVAAEKATPEKQTDLGIFSSRDDRKGDFLHP